MGTMKQPPSAGRVYADRISAFFPTQALTSSRQRAFHQRHHPDHPIYIPIHKPLCSPAPVLYIMISGRGPLGGIDRTNRSGQCLSGHHLSTFPPASLPPPPVGQVLRHQPPRPTIPPDWRIPIALIQPSALPIRTVSPEGQLPLLRHPVSDGAVHSIY